MKVFKEVEISEAEVDKTIVKGLYIKERKDFYRFGNDHYNFPSLNDWRKSKYNEMTKFIEENRSYC